MLICPFVLGCCFFLSAIALSHKWHSFFKHFDKRDDYNLEIVTFPFLDGEVPRPLPMVYIFPSFFVLQECVLMLMT